MQELITNKELSITNIGKYKQDLLNKFEQHKENTDLNLKKQQAQECILKELQKRYNDIQKNVDHNNKAIGEIYDKDFGKNTEIIKNEVELLEQISNDKTIEFDDMQKYQVSLFQLHGKNLERQVMDEQASELALYKRKIMDQENRSNDCQRKWKSLFQENFFKKNDTKGQNLQINRQNDTYQQIYTDFDKTYFDNQNLVNNILTNYQQNGNKDPINQNIELNYILDASSNFLIQVVQNYQNEITSFLEQNHDLKNNTEDLQLDQRRFIEDLDYYQRPFKEDNSEDYQSLEAIHSIRFRIEELFDLLEEVKHFSDKGKIDNYDQISQFLTKRLRTGQLDNQKLADRIKSKFLL